MRCTIKVLGLMSLISLMIWACKPETLQTKQDFSKEVLFQQVLEKSCTDLVRRSKKNELPEPTSAKIAAVAQWLEQNQSLMRKYMQIWMKGSLKMVENSEMRYKMNQAAHQYESTAGVDFYAPFREVIPDSSTLVAKMEQSLQQYASNAEMLTFQTQLGVLTPNIYTISDLTCQIQLLCCTKKVFLYLSCF